jgi:hypothetical protein
VEEVEDDPSSIRRKRDGLHGIRALLDMQKLTPRCGNSIVAHKLMTAADVSPTREILPGYLC